MLFEYQDVFLPSFKRPWINSLKVKMLSIQHLPARKPACPSIIVIITIKDRKNIFLNEQRSRDAAAKKRANTSGVGKINNYCEDIYIPPYNNTH